MHPLIRKWVQHEASHQVEYDYCQFGMDWKKPTGVLSVGGSKLHTGSKIKCTTVWRDGLSIRSRSGKPHVTLSCFTNAASKGQCNTNKACPYPLEFCKHTVEHIVDL